MIQSATIGIPLTILSLRGAVLRNPALHLKTIKLG